MQSEVAVDAFGGDPVMVDAFSWRSCSTDQRFSLDIGASYCIFFLRGGFFFNLGFEAVVMLWFMNLFTARSSQ